MNEAISDLMTRQYLDENPKVFHLADNDSLKLADKVA